MVFPLTYLHDDSSVSQVLVLNSFVNDFVQSASVQQKGDFTLFFRLHNDVFCLVVASCQVEEKEGLRIFLLLLTLHT